MSSGSVEGLAAKFDVEWGFGCTAAGNLAGRISGGSPSHHPLSFIPLAPPAAPGPTNGSSCKQPRQIGAQSSGYYCTNWNGPGVRLMDD